MTSTEQLKALATPIDRKTVIDLAKEAGFLHPNLADRLDKFERFYDLAVAHSRKDAEPVAICAVTPQGELSVGWRAGYKPQHNEKLFTHPPEADKLLQQALEALETTSVPAFNFAGNVNYLKLRSDIRTYLEGKE